MILYEVKTSLELSLPILSDYFLLLYSRIQARKTVLRRPHSWTTDTISILLYSRALIPWFTLSSVYQSKTTYKKQAEYIPICQASGNFCFCELGLNEQSVELQINKTQNLPSIYSTYDMFIKYKEQTAHWLIWEKYMTTISITFNTVKPSGFWLNWKENNEPNRVGSCCKLGVTVSASGPLGSRD